MDQVLTDRRQLELPSEPLRKPQVEVHIAPHAGTRQGIDVAQDGVELEGAGEVHEGAQGGEVAGGGPLGALGAAVGAAGLGQEVDLQVRPGGVEAPPGGEARVGGQLDRGPRRQATGRHRQARDRRQVAGRVAHWATSGVSAA